MFGKRKARENQEITALMGTSLRDLYEQFDAVEKITDVAEKIVKLQELKQAILRADASIENKQTAIMNRRMYANPVAFFTAWPKGTKKKLYKQNPGLADFSNRTLPVWNSASTMLDKAIESCNCDMDDLEKIARSPYFSKAFKNCEQLQDIFNAAMVKKATFGNSPAPQETTPATEPAEPRTSRIRRDSIPRI